MSISRSQIDTFQFVLLMCFWSNFNIDNQGLLYALIRTLKRK